MHTFAPNPWTVNTFVVRGWGTIVLGPALGEGAEGTVHAVDPSTVVKVYRPERVTSATVAKLELMVATPVSDPRLAWPTAIVEDLQGRVVGYAMPRAEGRTLQTSVFVPDLLAKHFPRWTRLELVELAIALVSAVESLHRHGVLVGDVNGGNIIVGESPRSARFVDLDSCQIGDFRSPVGTVPFLSRRLLGLRLDSISRTFADECFAIATLLFMVLVPGKPPYSRQGGGDPVENVRAGVFPYASGTIATGASPGASSSETLIPRGRWAFVWSHLPRALKELFERAFAQHATVGPAEWRKALDEYRYSLLTGRATLDIFPSELRREPQPPKPASSPSGFTALFASAVAGAATGTSAPVARVATSDIAEFRSCVDCHSTYTLTTEEADWFLARGLSLPRRCEDCREALRDAPSTSHVCKVCSTTFELTAREARRFAAKGLSLPKRCTSCRALRRSA